MKRITGAEDRLAIDNTTNKGDNPAFGAWHGIERAERLRGFAGRYAPRCGNVGPAKRHTVCKGDACWDPNQFGWCRTCGGDAPEEER